MTTATYTLEDAGRMLVDGYQVDAIERRTGFTGRQIRKAARAITGGTQSSRRAKNLAPLPKQAS